MKIKPAQSSNFAVARALFALSDMFGRRMEAVDASQRYGSFASALRFDVQLLTISDVRSVQTL